MDKHNVNGRGQHFYSPFKIQEMTGPHDCDGRSSTMRDIWIVWLERTEKIMSVQKSRMPSLK